MNSKQVLIPLDLRRGTTQALRYVQHAAPESPFCVTLLYVIEVNIVSPDNRLYREIGAESEAALRQISRHFLGHEDAARISVRLGRADEEIVAEARSGRSELIILSASKPAPWRYFFRSRTIEHVLQAAPCPALVLPRSRPIAAKEYWPPPLPQGRAAPSAPALHHTRYA